MSSPIFVCDAQGQPLMPMAAAHARKLLRSGKASLLPHHAFTIIQLTHTIFAPVLRPVLLGIAMHLHASELFLLTEGVRDTFPLLYVIVDYGLNSPQRLSLRGASSNRMHQSVRETGWKRARSAFLQNGLAWSYRRHGRVVEDTIDELRTLVPISHVVMLMLPQSPGPRDSIWRSQHLLMRTGDLIAARLKFRGLQVSWPESAKTPGITPLLGAGLMAFSAQPTALAPLFVAARVAPHALNTALDIPIPSSTICKITHASHTMIGVVSGVNTINSLILRVPVSASSRGVKWHHLVSSISQVRMLQADRVAFVRVVPEGLVSRYREMSHER